MERPDRKYWLQDTSCKINTNIYAGKLEEYCNYLEQEVSKLQADYFKLSKRDRFLTTLENAGVGNWDGYEEAQYQFDEEES